MSDARDRYYAAIAHDATIDMIAVRYLTDQAEADAESEAIGRRVAELTRERDELREEVATLRATVDQLTHQPPRGDLLKRINAET